jgi:hypothetical protein
VAVGKSSCVDYPTCGSRSIADNSGRADMPKKGRATEAGKLAADVISSFGVAQPKRLKGPEWELGSRMMRCASVALHKTSFASRAQARAKGCS